MSDMETPHPGVGGNYVEKLARLIQEKKLPNVGITDVVVRHDGWCAIYKNKPRVMNRTQEIEAKQAVVHRIITYTPDSPPDAERELMRESLFSLEQMFTRLVEKRNHQNNERAKQQGRQATDAEIKAMRRASQLDAAWTHCLIGAQLPDGRRLCDSEANRRLLEDLIGVDTPSAARYTNLVLQFVNRFAFETPMPVKTAAEHRAEFERICKENFLSLNAANEALHKEGVGTEHWSGCSEVERQQYQLEAAQVRQKFLINQATPEQLKQEARYEFQTRRDEGIRADSQRRMEFVAQQQRGLYAVLPAVNGEGQPMDASYFRRLVAHDYPKFKALVKKFGSAAITQRMHEAA